MVMRPSLRGFYAMNSKYELRRGPPLGGYLLGPSALHTQLSMLHSPHSTSPSCNVKSHADPRQTLCHKLTEYRLPWVIARSPAPHTLLCVDPDHVAEREGPARVPLWNYLASKTIRHMLFEPYFHEMAL